MNKSIKQIVEDMHNKRDNWEEKVVDEMLNLGSLLKYGDESYDLQSIMDLKTHEFLEILIKCHITFKLNHKGYIEQGLKNYEAAIEDVKRKYRCGTEIIGP